MTFDPFGDFDTRGYLRNTKGLKDPEAVRLFEHAAFRLNIEDALAALRATALALGYQDVMDTHERLFGAVYPWAGQDREALAPQVAVGKGGRYDLLPTPAMPVAPSSTPLAWLLTLCRCGPSRARSWACFATGTRCSTATGGPS